MDVFTDVLNALELTLFDDFNSRLILLTPYLYHMQDWSTQKKRGKVTLPFSLASAFHG